MANCGQIEGDLINYAIFVMRNCWLEKMPSFVIFIDDLRQ